MEQVDQNDDATSVRVAVRIRPLIGREKVDRCDECVSVLEDEMQVVIGKNRSFTYDYAFSKYAQQSDIWRCVEPLVKANFDGYNATIFAYGQTGSGKTFTMGSGSCVHMTPEDYGIIPRVIAFVFDQIALKTDAMPQYKTELKVRFLEVYGEEIRDLLVQFGNAGIDQKVSLREGENGEVQVMNAIEEEVQSADDCLRLLERGTLCRTTASTLMNAHSSRSHAIFTLTMVQRIPHDAIAPMDQDDEHSMDGNAHEQDGDMEVRRSYFNFVDLAGSERQKRTQAEGKRLKEGIEINKGLLALGNVISALGDDKKRGRVHVPYRDSKLTRMLQDSLGGNSRTLMLTCVSPADVNFEETLNALKYANRARNIKNKPVVNRDESSALTAELRRQVQMLQEEVLRLRNPGITEQELKRVASSSSVMSNSQSDLDSYGNIRSRAENAEREVLRLTTELKRWRSQMDALKEEMIAAQTERDYLRLLMEDKDNSEPDESTDGMALATEREQKKSILADHLRTICELQEKLRATEAERDRAVLSLSNPVTGIGMSSGLLPSQPQESELALESDLIEKAEKEIERETAILKRLKSFQETGGADAEASGSAEAAGLAADSGSEAMQEDSCEGSGNEDMVESASSMDDASGGGQLSCGGGDGNGSLSGGENEVSEEDADRQRVFERQQRQLSDSVQDLSLNIALKEQLLQQVKKSHEQYDRMKSHYEQKMAEMIEEVRIAQSDRDKLFEEIQQLEAKLKAEGSGGDKTGRLAKLSRDLKAKEAELMNLKKKQAEINSYITQKKKSEMQLRVLNAEISQMKRQKVDLIRKMQAERKKYEEEASRRRQEILRLKKSALRDKEQIQRLGNQKEAQERVLKRKMEEISAAKQRLKQQQMLAAQNARMNAGRRSAAARRNRISPRNRQLLANEEDSGWLSEEVKKRAEEQQKLEQLQKEREVVAKEMEALYAERDRVREELRRSLPVQTNIRDVLISPMKRQDEQLVAEVNQAATLSQEEEQLIYDLEERIEACQAQLEYKEEKITEMMGNEDLGTGSDKIESAQSLPEARILLKMLFGMAVNVKKQDQQKEQAISKLQVELGELSRTLELEREKTQQMRQNYEESLAKMMASHTSQEGYGTGMGSSGIPSPYTSGSSIPSSPFTSVSTPTPPPQPSTAALQSMNERGRILLSVSEERNAVLRKKCDELELVKSHAEKDMKLLQEKLNQEHRDLVASKKHIKWLETELNRIGTSSSFSSSSLDQQQPHYASGTASSRKMLSKPSLSTYRKAPYTKHTLGGGVRPEPSPRMMLIDTEVNESNEDHRMEIDEEGAPSSISNPSPLPCSPYTPSYDSPSFAQSGRRNFQVAIERADEDNAMTTQEQFDRQSVVSSCFSDDHEDLPILEQDQDQDQQQQQQEQDEPFSERPDDCQSVSSSTVDTPTSGSIFSRLSNPSTFTGIHKNRVRENVSKREVLQSRQEKNRARRLKDRGGVTRTGSKASMTPTSIPLPPPPYPSSFATPCSGSGSVSGSGSSETPRQSNRRTNPVMEVLAHMKRENEMETNQKGSSGIALSSGQPQSDYQQRSSESNSFGDDEAAPMEIASSVPPPPAPQLDVYSRLAGQYTTAAKNKRQAALLMQSNLRRNREQQKESPPRQTHRVESQRSSDVVEASSQDANSSSSSNLYPNQSAVGGGGEIDPLTGSERLVVQVHDDYREKLSHRGFGNSPF